MGGLGLRQLLAPVTPDEFFGTSWERRHLFIHRRDPSRYGALFSFADVDRWIAAAQSSPAEILLLVPPPDSGRRTERRRLRDVPLARLYQAFADGDTIVLEGIQTASPPVAGLAAALAADLGARVTVNLYMTPAGAQGAPLHPDVQDVFVLQVDGAKEWFVHERTGELCLESLIYLPELRAPVTAPPDEPPLVERATLETGDLLYLPRGVPHKAVASAGRASLHLAVLVEPLTWLDLVRAAAELASVERPELARAVRPGASADDFAAMLRLVAESAPFERALDLVARARERTARFPADGHFEQIVRLGELTGASVIARRPGLTCRVEPAGNGVSISFAGTRLQMPAATGPALEHIRAHERFRVRDLPGRLDEAGKLVLVRRLVREGLLRAEEH